LDCTHLLDLVLGKFISSPLAISTSCSKSWPSSSTALSQTLIDYTLCGRALDTFECCKSFSWCIPLKDHTYIQVSNIVNLSFGVYHRKNTHIFKSELFLLSTDFVHITIMSTIKLDHIELLTGSSNFEIWKHGISQVLQGEGYWGHVKGDVNIYSAFPIEPQPVTPTVTSAWKSG
jgi:hypothetical protein